MICEAFGGFILRGVVFVYICSSLLFIEVGFMKLVRFNRVLGDYARRHDI